MPRSDLLRSTVLVLTLVVGAGPAFAADGAPQRYGAPITILQAAPFVELALPPSAYAYSMQAGLRDLRLVDAHGERVPFALLAPAAAPTASERLREAALYPLPPRPVDGSAWRSPVDVTVEGDRISVHRAAAANGEPNPFPAASPGWLIDLGQSQAGEPAPRRVRLSWSGPPEFSVAYTLEASDDLRTWRALPGGQLMSLRSATDTLTQPLLAIPERSGRFLRLVWLDRASAPSLSAATSPAPAPGLVVGEAAKELRFSPQAEAEARPGNEAEARRTLYFDLGGALPLIDLDLRFSGGTRIAPVRVQGRVRAEEPWHELGSGVFFRLERDGAVAESPAIALPAQVRFLRLVADERAAPLDAGATQLVVHARLATLVFAAAGQAPFRLLAGSADASDGALPAATLVPHLDDERLRFGRAELGAFSEDSGVAQAAERAERVAHLRPWLLWAVLLVGVAVLAALVWRLALSGPEPKPPQA
jgi:uncharacterized protein DUF3999